MKRTLAALLCIAVATTQVSAGGPADPVIEAPVIVEDTASSSSGVAVPLLLLAVVLIAATSSSSGGGMATSDVQLKTDITRVGTTVHGLPLYQFRYIGGDQMFEGVMAQDVAKVMPEAVVPFAYGFSSVNYERLGITMRAVD
ncbi:MAG: tail fiber domain-containing protein [Pseudomonadota bacterium]